MTRIASAERSWRTLKEGLLFGYQFGLNHRDVPEIHGTSAMEDKPRQDSITAFQTAMDDDCNTPEALAVLFELAKELRRESNMCLHTGNTPFNLVALHHKWQTLGTLAGVLGLEVTREEGQNQGGLATVNQLRDDQIEALIHLRQTARVAKNWSESDRIRTHLQEHGITLIDQPGGITHWHRT
jgi:cysteinyl-tRNA synthetase